MKRALPLCTLLSALALAGSTWAEDEYALHSFERKQLADVFYCEGATFGDLSGDGVADLVSGPFWYEGPEYSVRHEYYAPKPFDIRGYSDNFFAFLQDFSGDGWLDILIIGFPGKDASWFENPRGKSGHWTRHVVFDVVDNESPTFADLTGDGLPELICQTNGRFGYATPDWAHPERAWKFTAISSDRKLGRFTHGLGLGDVNGDGRVDLLERTGWYEQPESLSDAPLWTHHPAPLAGRGGAQMYAYDVDGDGDNDVITSLDAHGRGLAWHENVPSDGEITFRTHLILEGDAGGADVVERPSHDVDFAELHAIELADMNGDGLLDIVTGVRFQAHYRDEASAEPAWLYWFELTRRDGEATFVPHLIDDASGVGTQVVVGDVNGDALLDVVVGNKKGTFLLTHSVEKASRADLLRSQPKVFHREGLTPDEAAAAMTVPEGFEVDLIAGEPMVHQPVAFAIDHRGRLWVAEAFTYPRRVRGAEGRWNEGDDKIIILEDSDADGSFETRTVFAEGLNLVSGLEVGFGGVWVGAAPYLLFFPDANDDDRPDGEPEVLLDGFGFHDTHETLNSFIWGPDGWLYGCHGVFTHSRVGKPGTPDAERVPLNAGFWRYHPRRHEFEVFAWGTSNPWGIDFNDLGQAFATACVIPHLYHVIQGGRYQRQAGRHFNPHVYDDIQTIADHRHYAGDIRDHAWWGQEPQAPKDTLAAGGGHAHCGAMVYLGDGFPESYRDKLFMNNIHGNRINCDVLERRGSGYVGRHGKDLVIANNAWYRGINLKYGPDGSVFFIDWYDRNACHRTNPEIWDRTNGRVFRLRYGELKTPGRVDLAKAGDAQLAEMQLAPNEWHVRMARRLLQERGGSDASKGPLLAMLSHADEPRRLRALWTLHVTGALDDALALEQLSRGSEFVRGWTIQLAAEDGRLSEKLAGKLAALARSDTSPVVRRYLASALQRLPHDQRLPIAQGLVSHAEDADDHNLPLLIWYGVEAIAETMPEHAMELARRSSIPLVTRYMTRRVASDVTRLEPLMAALASTDDAPALALLLRETLEAFRGHVDIAMPTGWTSVYDKLAASDAAEVRDLAQEIAVRFGDRRVFPRLRDVLADKGTPLETRLRALKVLIDGSDAGAVPTLHALVEEPALRGHAIRALALFDDPGTPSAVVAVYSALTTEEKRDAVNTLSSRPPYAAALLEAVRAGTVPRTDLTAFTIRQLRGFKDEKLDALVAEVWGAARETSEDKVAQIATYKAALTKSALAEADLGAGREVFTRVCAQCHSLFGAGESIAPDLTGSNRADLDYILENMVDPNAVVGKDYQMHVVITRDGRLFSGLILNETDSAITLRTINDEVVVARRDIIQKTLSENSLMPEELLDPLSAKEVRDLVAYLGSPTQVFLRGVDARVDPRTHRVAGALEGESLKVAGVSGGNAAPQAMQGFGRDKWSANNQLWWTGAKPGDTATVEFSVSEAGTYHLDIALTRAPDYAIVQMLVDGEPVESPIDLYESRVVPTGTLRLGEFTFEAGVHRLGIRIVGANEKATKSYMAGLDFVLLDAVR